VRAVTDIRRAWATVRRALPWFALIAGVLWTARNVAPAGHFPVGGTLPGFRAELSDGSAFTLTAAPAQVLVLSFWASYCAPCRAEAPLLSAAQADDVRVVGLSVEATPISRLGQQARGLGIRFPVGIADDELLQRFQIRAVPTTYVVARDGVIVMSRVGAITDSELQTALAAARKRAG
jgi:cytochrome c biogenesis protein CcmG/thiol:disulfide interchange protein DsbE